jgi:hypothetical protein
VRGLVAAGTLVLVVAASHASAEPRSVTRDSKTLTVATATDLPASGTAVRVTGRGYDRSKGIYVAFCVDNGPGKVPTPCGGGADTEGSSGNSVWISDFPPAYGTGLAKPYGAGGTFDVQIRVAARLRADDPETAEDETVDCLRTRCAVVTRNDHTRSEDRSQDVAVPITFATGTAPASAPRPTPEDAVSRAPVPPGHVTASPGGTSPTRGVEPVAPASASPIGTSTAAAEQEGPAPSPVAAGDVPVLGSATAPSRSAGLGLPVLVGGGAVGLAGAAIGARAWRRRLLRGA